MNKKQIDELEDLANKFIIGNKPLTEEQRRLMLIMEDLQTELNKYRHKVKRIESVIDSVNVKIARLNNFEGGK